MASLAQRLVSASESKGVDPNLLLWLKHHRALGGTTLVRDLLTLVSECGGHAAQLTSKVLDEVTELLRFPRLSPVAPRHVVSARTKARALELANASKWPRPRQLFVVQTMGATGGKGSLFFVFQTFPDGLLFVRETMCKGGCLFEGEWLPVCQCYEHQWWPREEEDRVAHMLIDWEVEMGGPVDEGVALQMARRFPRWFHEQLVARNVVGEEQALEIAVKDKCRKGKVSSRAHLLVLVESISMRPFIESIIHQHAGLY